MLPCLRTVFRGAGVHFLSAGAGLSSAECPVRLSRFQLPVCFLVSAGAVQHAQASVLCSLLSRLELFLLIIWFSPFTCDSAWTLLVSEVQSQSFPEPCSRVLTLSTACSVFFIRSPPRCSSLHAGGFAHPRFFFHLIFLRAVYSNCFCG
jgi:hypothetical protein